MCKELKNLRPMTKEERLLLRESPEGRLLMLIFGKKPDKESDNQGEEVRKP